MRAIGLLLGSLVLLQFAEGQANLSDQWITFQRAGAENSKFQCFEPDNVAETNGYLVITTKLGTSTCSSFDLRPAINRYTSGFVSMRKFNFLYGTVTVRAKFGGGPETGAWPIIWMEDASCQPSDPTGTDNACNGQEIDLAEILGGDFTHVNQQIHVQDDKYSDNCKAPATDVSRNFHEYQLNWFPGSLVFRIDNVTTCVINKGYVPDAPMYLKINTFAGGYGGAIKDPSLPWTTLVDYVTVAQGTSVIFNDGFSTASADQPIQITTPIFSKRQERRSYMVFLRPFLEACLFVLAAWKLRDVVWQKAGGDLNTPENR